MRLFSTQLGCTSRTMTKSASPAYPSVGLEAQVLGDSLCGIVTRRSDHRAGGVAAGAARIEPRQRRGVGQPVGEPEGVVDVVDVPAGDAEVLFDLGRRERGDV